MSAPVFLVDRGLSAVAAGDAYVLDGAEGRHAGVVQRRGPGERIDIVDGAGVRLCCVIESVDSADVFLRVERVVVDPAPAVAVTLVQALAKGDRDELAIEAATEVGVDAVLPWQADRSIVIWRGTRAAKSQARWHATVRAATKQARRSRLPHVHPPVDSRALAARIAQVVTAGGAAVVLHEEAVLPLAEVPLPAGVGAPGPQSAAARGAAGPGSTEAVAPEVLVLVGPEGGISETEVAAFTAAGAVAARLGPHILRTSTAGPVAIAMVAERLGRWRVPESAESQITLAE